MDMHRSFAPGLVLVLSCLLAGCGSAKSANEDNFTAAIEAKPGVDHCSVIRTDDPYAVRIIYRNANFLQLPYLIETLEAEGVLIRSAVDQRGSTVEFTPAPEYAELFTTQPNQSRFVQGNDVKYFCPGKLEVEEVVNFIEPGDTGRTTVEYRWKTVDMPGKLQALADAGRLGSNRPQAPGAEPDMQLADLQFEGTATRNLVLMDDGWAVK